MIERARVRVRHGLLAAALGAGLALALAPQAAFAHGDMNPDPASTQGAEPGTGTDGGMDGSTNGAPPIETHLEVLLPEEAALGESFQAQAILTDAHGDPLPGMTIVFLADAFWGDGLQGHMVIGTAVTDGQGLATLLTRARTSGAYEVAASFSGAGRYEAVLEESELDVMGDRQLYSPSAGIRVPWLNLWVLAGVIAIVWSTYFLVGLRLIAIARPPRAEPGIIAAELAVPVGGATRRQFLARALPFGAQAGIAAIGTGLVAVVVRSPRTHGNLMAPPSTVDYHRSPVARIGQMTEMREMPMALDRTVSFRQEILPIFLRNGGPHVVAPESSPPPGGLRLDSYEGIMAKEGVVVPGKPDQSELIEHLLSVGMQMPPSVPPIPDEQIQLIVSWIAQGARNN